MAKIIESIVLASGGLDSTTLLYKLLDEKISFEILFVNYGQHCAPTELETLKSIVRKDRPSKIHIVNLSDIYRGTDSALIRERNLWEEQITYQEFYLPYRSLLLLTVGAAFAQARGYRYLYSAFIDTNHAQEIDCSSAFFSELRKIFSEYGGVQLIMPFRHMSKYEVAKLGIQLGAPIGYTFSCQASATIPCGACPNCVDRLEALRRLGSGMNCD